MEVFANHMAAHGTTVESSSPAQPFDGINWSHLVVASEPQPEPGSFNGSHFNKAYTNLFATY